MFWETLEVMMKWFVKNSASSHTGVLKLVLEIKSLHLKWEGHPSGLLSMFAFSVRK